MIRKSIKVAACGVSIAFAVFLVLFIALFVDWGRSSADRHQDYIIQQNASPDGTLIAEIRRATTAMWEGPDTVYVAIRRATSIWSDKVYSKTYECDDFSAFGLEWNGTTQLTVRYGECHQSKFDSPAEFAQENKVSKSDNVWGNVSIHYVDSHHVATR